MEAQKSDQSLSGIPNFVFSVSHTTRQPREGEINGVHYNFVTKDEMQKDIDDVQIESHSSSDIVLLIELILAVSKKHLSLNQKVDTEHKDS